MKALLLIFSVLLILLFAGLWIGNGSYPDRWRLQKKISSQKAANELQKERNRKIQAELDDLASGDAAIEERARSELGMTKKGETFYKVVLQPEPGKTDSNKQADSESKPAKMKKIKLLASPTENKEPVSEETNNQTNKQIKINSQNSQKAQHKQDSKEHD